MRKSILIILGLSMISCDGIHGWFPGYTEPNPSQKQPTIGCNKDLTVVYKNNCSENLIMYFIEVNPETNVKCDRLTDLGNISFNETKTVIIHQGKNGYFVFAKDSEGKCSIGHRKAEAWVKCEESSSDSLILEVCR